MVRRAQHIEHRLLTKSEAEIDSKRYGYIEANDRLCMWDDEMVKS